MKKVRVEREIPFAKVGEEFELTEDNTLYIKTMKELHYRFFKSEVDKLVSDGFLSWIEQPKSLEDKFNDFSGRLIESINDSADYVSNRLTAKKLSKIAKEHYLEAFDKAVDQELDSYANTPNSIHINALDRIRVTFIKKLK